MKSSIREFPDTGQGISLPIKVEKIIPIERGNLRAIAHISIAGKLTIRDLRIVQQEGQRAYVALPQREYTDAQGRKRFYSIVGVPEHVKTAIQNAVLTAWSRQLHQAPCPSVANSTAQRRGEWTR